jgi:hypothetical protein
LYVFHLFGVVVYYIAVVPYPLEAFSGGLGGAIQTKDEKQKMEDEPCLRQAGDEGLSLRELVFYL